MPERQHPRQIGIEVRVGMDSPPAMPADDTPFHIAILGDFRGASRPADTPVSSRRPIDIDRDDYDDVLARFAPAARTATSDGAEGTIVTFGDIDDFHPDRLYERMPLFRSLRELRARAADARAFPDVAREFGLGLTAERIEPPPARPSTDTARTLAGGSLLEQIVADTPADEPTRPAPRDELQAFIREAVAPHLVARTDPRQSDFIDKLDQAIASRMRAVLHDPAVQAIEALWRSLFFLVRNADTGTALKIRLIDISRAELAADLAGDGPVADSELSRVLRAAAADTPWSLLAGAWTFGPDARDAQLLQRLAAIASALGSPFIAAASPAFVGLDSFGSGRDPAGWIPPFVAEWEAFRHSAAARWIGLAMPRFLLRLPYGDGADECDAFAFEETPTHEDYLWGNPALLCARLLAESWSDAGADMRPGLHQDVGGLPYHVERVDGEPVPVPCAETLMSERAATRMMELGFMPLASMKDSDAVRLVRFQSVAEPLRGLAGRWNDD